MPVPPLTLFERYLYHEDRPAYPCWFLTRSRFTGTFKREALQRAWELVTCRHPLLRCVVGKNWRGRLVWQPLPEHGPVINWLETLGPSGWPEWRATDLSITPGIHLFLHEADGRTDLFLHAHHAVHDGAGHFAVLDDLLVHYARELGADVALTPLDQLAFPARNSFGLTVWDKLKLAPLQLVGLFLSFQLRRRQPRTLNPGAADTDEDRPVSGFPALVSRKLPSEDSAWLEHTAKLLHTGLHNLLIRDAHAALGAWLQTRPDASSLDWIYLLVPVNLRRSANLTLPAANLVGLVILARQLKALGRRERLLQRTNEDMRWIKRGRLGYVFLVQLRLWSLLPGGILRASRSRANRVTFLFTNLGNVLATSRLRNAAGKIEVPGAVMEDLNLAPPCRAGTHAALAVGFYAGRFWADLQYDPRALGQPEGEALLETFFHQLRLSQESVG
jgi:hypothetical protein